MNKKTSIIKNKKSMEKNNDKFADINNKGNTFPNSCLPDINSKIKKNKQNDNNGNNTINVEEEKVCRETDINIKNNPSKNRKRHERNMQKYINKAFRWSSL